MSQAPSGQATPSTNTPIPPQDLTDRIKDGSAVIWSFTQLLLKKAPIAVDTNPIKIAFGLAQIAVELKKVRVSAISKCQGANRNR
jgi:hypothetical protein